MLSMSQMELDVCFGVISREVLVRSPKERTKARGKRRFALFDTPQVNKIVHRKSYTNFGYGYQIVRLAVSCTLWPAFVQHVD